MTEYEYARLQDELSCLMKKLKQKYRYSPCGKDYQRGYQEAVLACKSVLSHYNPKRAEE